VAVAAAVWDQKGCNALADQDAIKTITFRINGGYVGLAEREEWLLKTKAVWKP
jgi:putative chitinase